MREEIRQVETGIKRQTGDPKDLHVQKFIICQKKMHYVGNHVGHNKQ